jgi:hypothetical protein
VLGFNICEQLLLIVAKFLYMVLCSVVCAAVRVFFSVGALCFHVQVLCGQAASVLAVVLAP